MGIGIAFATGVLKGANAVARERAEEQKKIDEENRAFDIFKKEQTFTSGLETDKAVAVAKVSAENKKRQQTLEFFKALPDEQKNAWLQQNRGMFPGITDEMLNTANAMSKVNTHFKLGQVEFKNPDLKGTEGVYNQGTIKMENIERQLANPEFFDSVVSSISQNESTFAAVRDYLMGAEQDIIEGYRLIPDKALQPGEVLTTSIKRYTNVNRLIDSMGGLHEDREAAETEVNKALANTPDGRTPIAFTITVDEDGNKKQYLRNISNDNLSHINDLSAKHGMTPGQFVESFKAFRDIPTSEEFGGDIYMNMSDAEIADAQYSMLNNVLEMQKRGFGEILANPLAGSPKKKEELVSFLNEKYGDDRYGMAVALGYMLPTDEVFLVQPTGGRLYKPTTRKTGVTVNGRQFMMDELGYTNAEITAIKDGFKYSRETVDMLKQLSVLEATVLKDEQGFAREVKRVMYGAGAQAKQLGGVLKDVVSSGEEFEGNYKKNPDGSETTVQSINESVQKLIDNGEFRLSEGSTLANISEADALKLALAARMARAIDPSGRLSNQDFEIQLKRLGGALLGDAQSVQRQLGLLLDEFGTNMQRNSVLATVSAVGTKIDATTARAIRADRMLETSLVGSGTYAPNKTTEKKETPPSQVDMNNYRPFGTGFVKTGGTGPAYLDAEGNPSTRREIADKGNK